MPPAPAPSSVIINGKVCISVAEAGRRIGAAKNENPVTRKRVHDLLIRRKFSSVQNDKGIHFIDEEEFNQYLEKSLANPTPGRRKRTIAREG
jgi:hypothetical protein